VSKWITFIVSSNYD